jgi:hypothetical protein
MSISFANPRIICFVFLMSVIMQNAIVLIVVAPEKEDSLSRGKKINFLIKTFFLARTRNHRTCTIHLFTNVTIRKLVCLLLPNTYALV